MIPFIKISRIEKEIVDMNGFLESDFLRDGQDEYQRVEIDLILSFWLEIKVEISLHQWNEQQGLRNLLAEGLASLKYQRQSERVNQDESTLRNAVQKIHAEQVHLYRQYAEMKHYASELKKICTSQEVQLKACQSQLEMHRKVNQELVSGLLNKR